MKKQLSQLLIASAALVLLAGIAHAYTPPKSAPGAGNTDAPITTASTNQVKSGGLSVGTFVAQKDADFEQMTFLNGMVLGGSSSDTTDKPVTFGSSASKVNVLFTGRLEVKGVYQSDSLKTGGGKKPICANADGVLYICDNSSYYPNPPLNSSNR